MASSWGSSWGAAWGSSWGAIGVRGGDGFSSADAARRRERRERYKRNRHPIIRDEAEQIEVAEAIAEILIEVPEFVASVEEAIRQAVTVPQQPQSEPFDYAGQYGALRALLEREAARQQDEEDIELLLLAA